MLLSVTHCGIFSAALLSVINSMLLSDRFWKSATTGCRPLSHLVTDRRLRLFGHIAHSSPQEDHHHAGEATPGFVQWRQTLANRTLALHLPGGRQLFVTTGGTLWTQQRSSGVCYKRKKRRICKACHTWSGVGKAAE